jgi:hypothetical protein
MARTTPGPHRGDLEGRTEWHWQPAATVQVVQFAEGGSIAVASQLDSWEGIAQKAVRSRWRGYVQASKAPANRSERAEGNR